MAAYVATGDDLEDVGAGDDLVCRRPQARVVRERIRVVDRVDVPVVGRVRTVGDGDVDVAAADARPRRWQAVEAGLDRDPSAVQAIVDDPRVEVVDLAGVVELAETEKVEHVDRL